MSGYGSFLTTCGYNDLLGNIGRDWLIGMQSNLDVKSFETSILTFAELLKTALLFNPLTHASIYAKAQQFTVAAKGKFNAQVTEFAGEKRVDGPKYEFNLGVWYSLLDSIACICADNRFFSEIETGTITPSISERFDGSLRFQNYSAAKDRIVLIYPDFPRVEEKLRIALADQQIEIAVKFVSLHEQAHVFAGHLLYIVELGATKLLEIADDETEINAAEGRRAIELEADAIAFQMILQFCFGKTQELRAKEPRFFNIFSDTDWLIACVSATVIVCCLFEIADSVQTKKLEDRLHPSAKCRTLSVFQGFCRDTSSMKENVKQQIYSIPPICFGRQPSTQLFPILPFCQLFSSPTFC